MRGSTTTLLPVMVAIVRAMDSMSALAKFRVTGSPGRMLAVPALTAVCASAAPLPPIRRTLAAMECSANR
jgi:hypothetical protein